MNIGNWLGIKFKKKFKGKAFLCANNTKFIAYPESIKVHFGSKEFTTTAYFTQKLPKATPVILGIKGFFGKFKVTFDLSQNEIKIT
jgi:hypothetical protein